MDSPSDPPGDEPVHPLDVLGEPCPLPVLKVMALMRKLAVGERVEMVGDDPGIAQDIPAWCRQTGHCLLDLEEDLGVITCLIEKVTADDEGDAPHP